MEDGSHKTQFFIGESDEDSLNAVDNQTNSCHNDPDPSKDVGDVSTSPLEEQTELPVFSENIQHDGEVPPQVSSSYEEMRAPTNQENFDVPAVLTDSCDSVVCTEAVDGGVPVGGNEEAAYFAEASVSQAHAASHGCQSSLPVESEEAPIEVVEIDVENCGEISNAPVKNSFYSQAKKHSIHNRDLCDISDDEMDQLPRARPSRELDELVDCNSFRNGTARAASIPPESPSSDKNFIYGEELSPISAKSSEPTISDKYNGILREHPRTGLIRDREISRSPPPPSTLPRDDRRARLENLKKLNFPTKYKMKERIDDVSYGPSTSPYDTYDYTPRRHVRSFLDEPGSEFLSLSVQRQGTDNPIGRNRSPDYSSRRKRRYDDDGERGDDREKNRGGWLNASERRSNRDDWRFERDDRLYTDCQDNGLEDLSNNPLELQRRCNIQIVLSENQAAGVSDDQLFNVVSETLYLLANAQRLSRKREKLLNEMKAMRQDEVDMMKAIHADLPAHLQSVVRIEGDNVFINEAGLGGLQTVGNGSQFQQFPPCGVPISTIYMNPVTAPPVVMSSFMVPPGMQSMMSGKPTMSGMAPAVPSGLHVQVPESAAVAVTVPPPAESISPDAETGAESTMTSSFANIPSTFSHPPPPISSGPTPGASSSICPSSPGPAIPGLPDFSKPPPTIRPVNGTSNGSLPKNGSSSALPDVAVPPSTAPTVGSTTVPPTTAPPLNFNVPPPNVTGGAVTARAPYMQSSRFLGPPPGTSNPAQAQDFTKTITNMITSALKAPASAAINAFGARPGVRTFGPGMSLMAGPPTLNMHDNGLSGDVEWTNNRSRYLYRGKSGYGKRQGNDRRDEKQRDGTPRSFDSPKQ